MTAEIVEGRLRRFLLILTGVVFVGTVVELLFTDHMGSPVQFIPYILAGIGLIAIVTVLLRPQRGTLLALRGIMAIVTLGSLFGIVQHIESNLTFELEIQAGATIGDVFVDALGGATPLLAPGILALAAIIALVATYYHPALGNRRAM